MSHSTCTHRGWIDSRLLVVGSQIVSLTTDPSFVHNLFSRCLNGSSESIFDIYTSRPFQWYKEHIKSRCFDPCNRTLSFQESSESRRTPKSAFWECECRPHTPSKWGCDRKHRINMFKHCCSTLFMDFLTNHMLLHQPVKISHNDLGGCH